MTATKSELSPGLILICGIIVGILFDMWLFGVGTSYVGAGHGSPVLYNVFCAPANFGFYLRPIAFMIVCSKNKVLTLFGVSLILVQLMLGLLSLADADWSLARAGKGSAWLASMKLDLAIYYLGHLAFIAVGLKSLWKTQARGRSL